MARYTFLAGVAAVALMAFAAPARAGEFTEGFSVAVDTAWSSEPVAVAAPAAVPASEPAAEPAPVISSSVLSQDALADLSGQGDGPVVALTEQALTALNSGNAVIGANVGSGGISIDQNAFTGFDGIGNFVINSGHNNTLQSSLSVSIVITQ